MRRAAHLLSCLVLSAALGGCGWVNSKGDQDHAKRATTMAGADSVLIRYNRVRARAEASVDPAPLADIEAGPLLAIDRGAFFLRQRLPVRTKSFRFTRTQLVVAGRFDSYPLWFAMLTEAAGTDQKVAAVFTRPTSTSPWRLIEAPRLARSTQIGPVAQRDDGSAVILAADGGEWSDGRTVQRGFPQQLVDDYAATLADPDGPTAGRFVQDSFISQMRTLAEAQPVSGVIFEQEWSALPVHHVVRLRDEGVLVFATLVRTDRYTLEGKRSLDFAGLEAAAYFSFPVTGSATLNYRHQVLMLVPAEGKPLVIGQYGGLISASGS